MEFSNIFDYNIDKNIVDNGNISNNNNYSIHIRMAHKHSIMQMVNITMIYNGNQLMAFFL